MLRKIAWCSAAGTLAGISFWHPAAGFLAWGAFVPWLLMLSGAGVRNAFVLGLAFGAVFWLVTMYWLVHVTFLGTAVLLAYLALYPAIFSAGYAYLLRAPLSFSRRFFALPCLWVLLEFVRSHLFTGLPWALMGNSQAGTPWLVQTADIGGVWLVSFLVMVSNVALAFCLEAKVPLADKGKAAACALILLISAGAYGAVKMKGEGAPSAARSCTISVVQGNIPQELKWDPRHREFILRRHLELYRSAAGQEKRPDLVVWPEASYPGIVEETPQLFLALSQGVAAEGVPLLAGAVTREEDRYYNAALLLDAQGARAQEYRKVHLVPFGEFVPFRRAFSFIPVINELGDITPGNERTVFSLECGVRFSSLICFEDLFPELSRAFVASGAQVLINITNDAWYGKSPAAWQHCQASILRAVENRVWVCRAANTGVSACIDPRGRVVSLVQDASGRKIFVPGTVAAQVAAAGAGTVYGKLGDWWVAVCALTAASAWIFRRKKR